MSRHLRKIVKRSTRKFEHSLSIPAEFVRKLELSGEIVEISIKGNSLIIKKVEEKLADNSTQVKSNSSVTIH